MKRYLVGDLSVADNKLGAQDRGREGRVILEARRRGMMEPIDQGPSRVTLKPFHEMLRAKRERHGITKARCANLASVPERTWDQFEDGTALPKRAVLGRLPFTDVILKKAWEKASGRAGDDPPQHSKAELTHSLGDALRASLDVAQGPPSESSTIREAPPAPVMPLPRTPGSSPAEAPTASIGELSVPERAETRPESKDAFKGELEGEGSMTRRRARNGFCKALREARVEIGLSQAQLAELVGVTAANVSHWENGTFMITKKNFEKLVGLMPEMEPYRPRGMRMNPSPGRGGYPKHAEEPKKAEAPSTLEQDVAMLVELLEARGRQPDRLSFEYLLGTREWRLDVGQQDGRWMWQGKTAREAVQAALREHGDALDQEIERLRKLEALAKRVKR